MAWDLNGQSAAVEQALAGGTPQRAGWFRFHFENQLWEWSEQVQQLHGYEPGTMTPSTDLVLSHKHPDDRDHVAATIDDILRNPRPFSTRHRIVDTAGHVRHVVMVGDSLHDDGGAVVGTYGFYVEVAPDSAQPDEDAVTTKLAEIADHRAGIEQAKGMLMLVYGIDDAAAFDLLKWLSQEANVKLRLLAEQICADFPSRGPEIAARSEFDHLLVTAYKRVLSR